MPPKPQSIQCFVFDLTLPKRNHPEDRDIIIAFFTNYCKKWCFQLERGAETGYEHYQCRMSLNDKQRLNTVIELVNNELWQGHVSTTSAVNHTKIAFYVSKEETRIDGPWRDGTNVDPHAIPYRFRGEVTMKPFQQTIYDMVTKGYSDDRTINVVYDPHGAKGKSWLADYMLAYRKALKVPLGDSCKEVIQYISSFDDYPCYFFDLARSTPKMNLNGLFSAMEDLKSGFVFETRYKGSFRQMLRPPWVWMFTNVIPNRNRLSPDRWRIWTVMNDHLVPWIEPPEVPIVGLLIQR